MGRIGRVGLVSIAMAAASSLSVVAGAAAPAAAAPASTPGHLIEYTLFPNGWSASDVTPSGGVLVAGKGTPFTDPLTGFENVYAASPTRDLIEYTRLPAGNWVTDDLTDAAAGGTTVGLGPQPFTDPLTGLQNVYATSTSGRLLEFTRLPAGNWIVDDLSAATGGHGVTGAPQPFTDPLTGFQNVYATGTGGDLVEFTRLPAGNWVADDLTAASGGPRVAFSPQPFTDPLTGFQNAYAVSAGAAVGSGDLVEFTRLPAGNWFALDLTAAFGGPPVTGDSHPFTDPLTGFQNAYVTSGSGDVVEFTRLPSGAWKVFDLTRTFSLPTIATDSVPFAVNGSQVVFGAAGGHMIEYSRKADGSWTAADLTQTTNGPHVTGDPAATIDPLTRLVNVYDTAQDPLALQVPQAAAFASGRAGVAGFTLIDTVTGASYGGGAATTQIRTASVIKVPIAMTLASQVALAGRGFTATESSLLQRMITQSDNDAATALWDEVGGSAAVVGEMRDLGATATNAYPPDPQAWGFTETTSRDLAVVLAALARGEVGSPGTNTILSLMHRVIPSQAWGIGAALPGSAIKNGWFPDPTDWRVNCLGIAGGTRYALAVMTEYPIGLGQGYGEVTCQDIAAVLLPGLTSAGAAPLEAPRATPRAPAANPIPALSGIGMTVDGG